jgi:hypothetical protein
MSHTQEAKQDDRGRRFNKVGSALLWLAVAVLAVFPFPWLP